MWNKFLFKFHLFSHVGENLKISKYLKILHTHSQSDYNINIVNN